ncbi:macrophage-expressed gene 1 protein-like [Saccostrea echinata]|uniref:macrophage-expressed gene 1 protein-like n=1 Tax=Saccostrea echinata TaxID=191078 RepID=UPI002A81C48A|nr:macrophage-expressed gene 1 protein-like [Saccostrea echinata]
MGSVKSYRTFIIILLSFFLVEIKGNVSNCKYTNTSIFGYEVLPGNGWDNLRNEVRGRVVLRNYSTCQITDDGRYLLPDGVFAIPLKSSQVELYSQLIENWNNFTSDTSASINLDGSITIDDLPINGKFSFEFQAVKGHQINDDSVTMKVKARYARYSARLQPVTSLDPAFMDRVSSIAQHIQFNRSASAKYESQLLVRDFGTHVVTSIDAGASIVKIDHINRSLLQDASVDRYQLSLIASSDLFHGSGSATVNPDALQKYYSSLTHSSVSTYGGPIYKPVNFSVNDWVEGIQDELVAVDRAGDPLHFLIQPKLFPNIPVSTVYELASHVDQAIKAYYKYNTHKGCTDRDSENFNYYANVDDGSCSHNISGLVFGGMFQQCNESGDIPNTCQSYESKNPLTGDFTCPEGFDLIPLFTDKQAFTQVKKVCSKYMVFWSKCHEESVSGLATFTSYWCAAKGQFAIPTGFLFGGVFSDSIVNSVTQQKTCPPYFNPIKTAKELSVCVTNDFENGEKYAMPFAGFFSCQNGNPLTGGLDTTVNTVKSCPPGYSQHLATTQDDCDLMYCTRPIKIPASPYVPVHSPPFMKQPLETNATSDFLVSDDGQQWTQLYVVDPDFNGFNGTVSGWIVNDGTNLNMESLLAIKQSSPNADTKVPPPKDLLGNEDPTSTKDTVNFGGVSERHLSFIVGCSIAATLFCVLFTTFMIAFVLRSKRKNNYHRMVDGELHSVKH